MTELEPVKKLKIILKKMSHCDICTEPITKKCEFTCSACKCLFCKSCFTNEFWSKPFCMNCNIELSNNILVSWLTYPVYLSEILNKYNKVSAFTREHALLNFTCTYIEWIKYVEYKKSFNRWGSQKVARGFIVNQDLEDLNLNVINIINPAAVEAAVANYAFYKCVKAHCMGLVVFGVCNKCKTIHCDTCQMTKSINHECDVNIIESIKVIKNVTKPCPSCSVPVLKDGGCDHMHCKKCNVHYFWSTGLIVEESQFHAEDRHGRFITLTEADEINFQSIDVQIKKLLGIIQQFTFLKYNLVTLDKKYKIELLKLRIKYIKNELTEDKWLNKVVLLDYFHQGNVQINAIISNFIDIAMEIPGSQLLDHVKATNLELQNIAVTYNCKVPIIFKDSLIPISMQF